MGAKIKWVKAQSNKTLTKKLNIKVNNKNIKLKKKEKKTYEIFGVGGELVKRKRVFMKKIQKPKANHTNGDMWQCIDIIYKKTLYFLFF